MDLHEEKAYDLRKTSQAASKSAGGAPYTSVGRTGVPGGRFLSAGVGNPHERNQKIRRAGGPIYKAFNGLDLTL